MVSGAGLHPLTQSHGVRAAPDSSPRIVTRRLHVAKLAAVSTFRQRPGGVRHRGARSLENLRICCGCRGREAAENPGPYRAVFGFGAVPQTAPVRAVPRQTASRAQVIGLPHPRLPLVMSRSSVRGKVQRSCTSHAQASFADSRIGSWAPLFLSGASGFRETPPRRRPGLPKSKTE